MYRAELRFGRLPPVDVTADVRTMPPLQAMYFEVYGSLTRGGAPLGEDAGIEFPHGGVGFAPREAGEYMAALPRPGSGSLFVPFSVYPAREEAIITAADPILMRQIAEAGGGEALSPNQLADLPSKLQEARAMMVTRHETRSAWDRSWVLAAILAALGLEWILRRRWGLV